MMLMDSSPIKDISKERVSMGGSAQQPYFKPLVTLTSYLVMSMHTETMPDDCPSLNKFKKSYESGTVPEILDKKFVISKQAKELFAHKDLMAQVLKLEWDTESYGKALSHLCYGDK
jgi:hypothetical protein